MAQRFMAWVNGDKIRRTMFWYALWVVTIGLAASALGGVVRGLLFGF